MRAIGESSFAEVRRGSRLALGCKDILCSALQLSSAMKAACALLDLALVAFPPRFLSDGLSVGGAVWEKRPQRLGPIVCVCTSPGVGRVPRRPPLALACIAGLPGQVFSKATRLPQRSRDCWQMRSSLPQSGVAARGVAALGA